MAQSSSLTSPLMSEHAAKTLKQTFATVSGMWLLTAVAAIMTRDMNLGLMPMLLLFGGGIALIFMVQAFRNSPLGLLGLALFSAIEGASIGPLIGHYLAREDGTATVGLAALLTAGAAGACTLYAAYSKRDFSRMRGFLFAGLIVFLLSSLAMLFFPIPGMNMVMGAVGALLFTGWMLYDLSNVIQGRETNYISAALGLYLDMLNFFLSILRLLGNRN